MMIVASNSITISNVNDGATVHIAYADSADGKDGFYVGGGINLLTGTSENESSGKSYWITAYRISGGLQPGTTYTLSGWARIDQTAIDNKQYAFVRVYTKDWSWSSGINFDRSLTAKYKQVTFTTPSGKEFALTVDVYLSYPNGDSSKASISGMGYISKLMLEEGTISHPWSPAPSEAHPIYMGTYTDYTQADSLDPTAYKWTKIKGDTGEIGPKGATGVGIKTLVPEYYISNSNEELAGGIWTDLTAYIWSSNIDPVAPDFTFTISNLVSTSVTRSPIVGDVIFCKEKYYTVSSISGTTLLATKKNNLMPSLATDYIFNQTDLKPYDSSVTDTTPSVYDIINCGFTKYSINSILGTTVVSNLAYTKSSPKWTTEYMFKVSDLTHVDTTLTDTPVVGDVIRSKIAANGVESSVFYKISRLSSDNLTVYGSLIMDSSTAKWIAEVIDWVKPQINNKYLWTRQHVIYNDGTEEYSNGIFDTNYTDLYSITTSNSAKIESTDSKISNTVTSIQTTKSLIDDLTGIVGKNATDTSKELQDLAKSTSGVSDSLTDYKKATDERVTTLETSSTQTATAFTDMVTKTDDLGKQVALASQMLDATGVHVKTSGSQTTSNINGDGINVTDTDGNMIVEFTYLRSQAAYLDVLEHLSFGAHRAEMLKDTDLDGTEVEGTAFFWIGDIK